MRYIGKVITSRMIKWLAGCGRNCSRCSFLLVFCTALILVSGCASLRGGAKDQSASTTSKYRNDSDDRLPFPGARRSQTYTGSDTNIVVSYPDYRDPIIWFNRAMFAFNDVVYRYALIPVSKGYVWVMPDPAEKCIRNFFYNLKSPIYLVNQLLQWEPKQMGRTVMRFGVNTTVGIAGLFDPAKTWLDMPREETHFDDTLAQYGAGYGFYIVLPIFGPSDVCNTVSTVAESFLNPIRYILDPPESTAVMAYDNFQEFAPSADKYGKLRAQSDDPYIFFRNLYLQGVQRDADY